MEGKTVAAAADATTLRCSSAVLCALCVKAFHGSQKPKDLTQNIEATSKNETWAAHFGTDRWISGCRTLSILKGAGLD
jgi:hypothetical protein